MKIEEIKDIYKKYNLDEDDIFKLKFGGKDQYLITRTGIEKIQALLSIQVNFKVEKISDDHKSCVILATGVILEEIETEMSGKTMKKKQPKIVVTSFGEASPSNNRNSFPVCMAEKRAKARVILQISGLYQLGIYSEDEADEFTK